MFGKQRLGAMSPPKLSAKNLTGFAKPPLHTTVKNLNDTSFSKSNALGPFSSLSKGILGFNSFNKPNLGFAKRGDLIKSCPSKLFGMSMPLGLPRSAQNQPGNEPSKQVSLSIANPRIPVLPPVQAVGAKFPLEKRKQFTLSNTFSSNKGGNVSLPCDQSSLKKAKLSPEELVMMEVENDNIRAVVPPTEPLVKKTKIDVTEPPVVLPLSPPEPEDVLQDLVSEHEKELSTSFTALDASLKLSQFQNLRLDDLSLPHHRLLHDVLLLCTTYVSTGK